MTQKDLQELRGLFNNSDILMLRKLEECCNPEDKKEVQFLIYLNDTVGIGWGEPGAPEHMREFMERQDEYYERRDVLLEKYAPLEFWQDGVGIDEVLADASARSGGSNVAGKQSEIGKE